MKSERQTAKIQRCRALQARVSGLDFPPGQRQGERQSCYGSSRCLLHLCQARGRVMRGSLKKREPELHSEAMRMSQKQSKNDGGRA